MSTQGHLVFGQNKLFHGLPPDILQEVNRIPEAVAYAPDEMIFDEGEPGDALYLIAEGVVRISKRGRGGQQETLAYLEAGDFFGEMAAFDPAPRSARATAVQEVLLGRVDRAALAELLQLAPLPLVENLTRRSMQRLRHTDSHLIQEVLEAERLSLVGSMASAIIHDLKNPIGVIHGAAQLLQERIGDEQLLKWVGMIERSTDRMLEMVQELLDYSRGNTTLSLAPVPIEEILQELDEQILRGVSKRRIRVETQVEFRQEVCVDRARFTRVLLNILKNAVEAMPAGGVLSLAVRPHGEQVCFSIADTGVGIPEHLLPTIFEPFVTHGKASGTGLGMAIAKSVVDAHRGRIAVESTPGVGTRFEIIIPREGPR